MVERLNDEFQGLPLEKQDIERCMRIDAWIDAGHGSCVLREPSVAAMVQNSLCHFDGQRYRLLAWVVMPNHVHVLFQPINGWTVAKIVASWKKFTARWICDYRKATDANQAIGEPGKKNANRAIGGPGVWHREYWDRFIRNNRHLQQAIEYIALNPVRAELVRNAEDWCWSSAALMQQYINPVKKGHPQAMNEARNPAPRIHLPAKARRAGGVEEVAAAPGV